MIISVRCPLAAGLLDGVRGKILVSIPSGVHTVVESQGRKNESRSENSYRDQRKHGIPLNSLSTSQ